MDLQSGVASQQLRRRPLNKTSNVSLSVLHSNLVYYSTSVIRQGSKETRNMAREYIYLISRALYYGRV